MHAHPLVLLVQDTTCLNYMHHPATEGLGSIGGRQRGSVLHGMTIFTYENALGVDPVFIIDHRGTCIEDVPIGGTFRESCHLSNETLISNTNSSL